jgi:beta-hydroxylase
VDPSSLLQPKVTLFAAWVASAAFVHFRCRVRYGFWRQLTNYSTLLAPYSALMYLFSRVPTRPILDPASLPELAPLRENWETIRDEARRLYDADRIAISERYDDIGFNSFFKKGWKRFILKWYGEPLPSARDLCPKTVALVESIPSVTAAMFTLLAPRSRLPEHRDPFAGALRYHLGLVTPNSDRCGITIDGEPRHWTDGGELLFDETYLHRAQNDTDVPRIILFCDVARPLRTPPMRWLNALVTRHLVKISASRNLASEQVGLLNRLASRLHALRDVAKRIKRRSRPVYFASAYALKAAALAALLWLVFR